MLIEELRNGTFEGGLKMEKGGVLLNARLFEALIPRDDLVLSAIALLTGMRGTGKSLMSHSTVGHGKASLLWKSNQALTPRVL